MKPVFDSSDAWLLFSIAAAEGTTGADLRGILATGDWINHAIFSGPEQRRGLAKLIHAGHVTESAGRFHLAGPARERWAAGAEGLKVPGKRWKDLEDFLGVTSPATDPSFEDPDWQFPLTDEMVSQAYLEYTGR